MTAINNAMPDAERRAREFMEIAPGATLYRAPGASIFVANNRLEFPPGQHRHEEYEFAMPLNADLITRCDDIDVLTEKQKLTPFNSNQSHGQAGTALVDQMICLQCDKQYLRDLALEAFGNQGEVVFENVSFDVGPNIRFLLGLFVDESIAKAGGYHVMQDSLSRMLFLEILRRSRNNLNTTIKANGARNGIKRAVDFLQEHYARPLAIKQIAAVAGLSISHFMREFKAYTGKTPLIYLNDVRVANARELLMNKSMSIIGIAHTCGFANPGHFSTVFRQRMGMSPSDYRKKVI